MYSATRESNDSASELILSPTYQSPKSLIGDVSTKDNETICPKSQKAGTG